MTQLNDCKLYYMKTCPYCQKVLRFMEENDIELDLLDIWEPGVSDELIEVGGKKQVPCLVIDGKPMYESDDIIAYLKEKVA